DQSTNTTTHSTRTSATQPRRPQSQRAQVQEPHRTTAPHEPSETSGTSGIPAAAGPAGLPSPPPGAPGGPGRGPGVWGPGAPAGYLTTSAAAERKGMSISRIQHFCRAYSTRVEAEQRQRLAQVGVDPTSIAALLRRGPSVPPQDPQRPGELQCTWSGNGRRREYFIDPLALDALPVNTPDPVTGRQPRRGHRAGWEPEQAYRRADDATDLRHP